MKTELRVRVELMLAFRVVGLRFAICDIGQLCPTWLTRQLINSGSDTGVCIRFQNW